VFAAPTKQSEGRFEPALFAFSGLHPRQAVVRDAPPGETLVRLTKAVAPGEIKLSIEADGQGIPPEVLPRFFQLLAIAKPITNGGDLGLGPVVAERIVSPYGGAVSVDNLTPPGVRLCVRLRTP
jgi:C4-dicarboxylate-specific signal transduction histidine kinase